MKNNKWTRFWNIQKHSAGGFTLVELIVVIAILAILAGVGVPAYSGYVKKANIAADQQLISEVANALQLYYYSNPGAKATGYVVLSKSEGPSERGIDGAMDAAFGVGGWENLKLKDDGWDAKAISEAAKNPYVNSIPDSKYITNIGTEKLLGDVQHCATSFGNFLDTWKSDKTEATNALINGFADKDSIKGILAEAGYKTEADYANITTEELQNLTVFGVATEVKNNTSAVLGNFADPEYLKGADIANSNLTEVASWYAQLEALVAHLDHPDVNAAFYPGKNSEDLDTGINMNGDVITIATSMKEAQKNIETLVMNDPALLAQYSAYYTPGADGKSQAQKDGEAFVGIMSTVNNLQGDYTQDEDAMTNGELFTNGGIKERVDSFIDTAVMVKENAADIAHLQGLDGSAAVVRLNTDGTVTVIANNR